MKLRRVLVSVHVWLGLTIGALWAAQGLTGAALVFNRDIQPLLLPAVASDADLLPLDDIFEKASAAAGAEVKQLETFGPKPGLLVAYFETARDGKQTLVVDGSTGATLDRRDPDPALPQGGSTWKWLLHYHEALLSGEAGLLIVGSSGLLLCSSLILGLWLAWPRRRAWRQAYGFHRWRTAAQRLFGWHRMLGLTLGFVLLFSAISGALLAFSPSLRPLLVAAAGFRQPYKPAPVESLPQRMISAQQALDAARVKFPAAVMVRAVKPSPKAPVYSFRLLQQEELRRWAGTTTAAVDPASGVLVDSYDPLNAPAANRLSDLIYHLHTGEAGGIAGRLLVMLGGLMLPALYVTGVWAWLRRRKRRAAGTPARIAAAAVP